MGLLGPYGQLRRAGGAVLACPVNWFDRPARLLLQLVVGFGCPQEVLHGIVLTNSYVMYLKVCKRDSATPKSHIEFLRELSQELMKTPMLSCNKPISHIIKKRSTISNDCNIEEIETRASSNKKPKKSSKFTQAMFDQLAGKPVGDEEHRFRPPTQQEEEQKRLCQICKFNSARDTVRIDKKTKKKTKEIYRRQNRMNMKCLHCNLQFCVGCWHLIDVHK